MAFKKKPLAVTALPTAVLVILLSPIVVEAKVVVAYDLVDNDSHNLISHGNIFTGAFDRSYRHGFQKYHRGDAPRALLDDSNNPALANVAINGNSYSAFTGFFRKYGIVDYTDNADFFGMVHTDKNILNTDKVLTATWEFNVTDQMSLELSVDMAAIGDFERSDYFKWTAFIDEGAPIDIFQSAVDQSISIPYTFADGTTKTFADPIMVEGIVLDNHFATFTKTLTSLLAPDATGSKLTLTLHGKVNSDFEAFAFRSIKIFASDGGPEWTVPSVAPTPFVPCPERHCADEVVTTYTPRPGCRGSSLELTTLSTYTYGGETYIELLGPADGVLAAAIVISAPHGGTIKPDIIPDRAATGSFCPDGSCTTQADGYTRDIALALGRKIIDNYCTVPYVIVNHLHRSKLDANREILEAAQENSIAEDAWWAFHNFTNDAQADVQARFGTVDGGVRGILFDVHGYSGTDFEPENGLPLIQWGYRLSENTLNNYCPLDDRESDQVTLFHGGNFFERPMECLVRGPGSLGSRVSALTSAVSGDGRCGLGVPSYAYPYPYDLTHKSDECDDIAKNPDDECHYFMGGYDIKVHEYMDWTTMTGDLFNAVQAELPRCIRGNGLDRTTRDMIHEEFAGVLSVALCSFLKDGYGSDDLC